MSRPKLCAARLISATFFALPSSEVREPAVATKNASQLRSAKAWPTSEEPAFMMIGRVSPLGLGVGAHALEVEEPSVEIEIAAFRPGPLDDIEPFLGKIVARVVLALGHPEHLELALVPSDHEIDAEASFTDVVGGHEFLGRDQRVEQGRMHRAEYGHALGRREEADGPGDGLQRAAVKIGVAAVTLPAADRQHE